MRFHFCIIVRGYAVVGVPSAVFWEGKDERGKTIWQDCTSERAVLL